MNKDYVNYRIPIKETICALLEFQKEREERGNKIIFKKMADYGKQAGSFSKN